MSKEYTAWSSDMPGAFPEKMINVGDSGRTWSVWSLLKAAISWAFNDHKQQPPPSPPSAAPQPICTYIEEPLQKQQLFETRPKPKRKPLVSHNLKDRPSYWQNKSSRLVRDYTTTLYNTDYSYYPTSQTYTPTIERYVEEEEDVQSLLSVDSQTHIGNRPSWTTQSNKSVYETLYKKIQWLTTIRTPSDLATPVYDRLLQGESAFDQELEETRRKMLFKLPSNAKHIIKQARMSSFKAELNRVQVAARDIETLGEGQWFNDEVINFYMQMIMARSQSNPTLPRIHAFNTFFFSTLRDNGYARVKRWTRRVRLFDMDMAIVPVHLGVHWCCAVVDFKSKSINYYDALAGDNIECLEVLLDYLRQESQDKLGQPFNPKGWNMSCKKNIPRQKNGYDCGVFAVTFAEHLSRNAPFNFSQSNCQFLRKKITYEIATQTLTAPLV